MKLGLLVFCCLLSVCLAAVDQWSALSIQVEPKSDDCFYETLDAGSVLELDFEVTRGGLLDIEIVVSDPTQNIIYRKLAFFNHQTPEENEREGFISVNAVYTGQYTICFNNKMSRWTPKIVSFAVRDQSKKKPEAAKVGNLSLSFGGKI